MAELADAIDLGSIPEGCRFKSCYPHQIIEYLTEDRLFKRFVFFVY